LTTQKAKKKRKSKVYKKAILLFILIFVIAVILIMLELKFVLKKEKNVNNNVSVSKSDLNIIENVDDERVTNINEGMSFETFVDKEYTQNEITSWTADEMKEIRKVQIDKKNSTNLSIKKIVGSASSPEEAMRLGNNYYSSYDQFVNSAEIALETDTYYIVKVNWDYISENVTRRYNNQVLVFKDFYYNEDTNVLNMDNIDKTKDVLDLNYYVECYFNVGKSLIQSFIEKNGERCEYILYYFDVEYGQDNVSDKIYLSKQVVQINSATGVIEDIRYERISSGVEM